MSKDPADLRRDITARLAAIDNVDALEVIDCVVRDMIDACERMRAAEAGAPSVEHGVVRLVDEDEAAEVELFGDGATA